MIDEYGRYIEMPEKLDALNGLRVEVIGEGKRGTVYLVYMNREERRAIIGVNMDGGGARVFFTKDLRPISPSLEQKKLLGLEDE